MSTHDAVLNLVQAYAETLSASSMADIQEALSQGNTASALSTLITALHEQNASSAQQSAAAWRDLAQQLGMDQANQGMQGTWTRLNQWLAQENEQQDTGQPDLLGVAATLLGMDKQDLSSMAGGILSGAQERLAQMEQAQTDLRSEDPQQQARGQATFNDLKAQLSALGIDTSGIPDGIPSTDPQHSPMDLEEGKALLARGLGVLQTLLTQPEQAEQDAQEFADEMEERFGHLIPASADAKLDSAEELKAHARRSIAASLSKITFE